MVRERGCPWEAVRAAAVSGLRERFGVPVWWGEHTRMFWAMVTVQGRPRLVEAITPEELARAIMGARSWPWPPAEPVTPLCPDK
ncbi:hypothetical protein GCM10009780_59950 [Actinomadura alba]